jgi:predicted ATPase
MLANRINRVTVRNFRSLADVSVDLEDLTILVGVNGSGKTNFIDTLRFVSHALRRGLGTTVIPEGPMTLPAKFFSVWRSSSKDDFSNLEIQLDLTLGEQAAFYSFALDNGRKSRGTYIYSIESETCRLGSNSFEAQNSGDQLKVISSSPSSVNLLATQGRSLILPLIGNQPEFSPLYTFLVQMRFYSMLPAVLRLPQRVSDSYPLDEQGLNFTAALRDFLASEDNKSKGDFYEIIARIVPGISKDNAIKVGELGDYLLASIKHDDERRTLPLEAESDGTLRIISLLLALYQQPSLPVVGIEEPDLMLHPGAMGILSDIIFAASHRSQIILTTHSPDLISRFKADTLRIVELVDGATKIGPIREDQRQIIEDQLFSGGDLLRLGGLARE